jgi:hypothetical protein
MKHTILAAALLSIAALVHAEANPAKKELVNKVLQLQQAAVDGVARVVAEQPALQLMQQAAQVLQMRVPMEKREALGKEIQADVKKYVDEAAPLVRERAAKIAPATVGALLEEKFSEDELRQLIAIMESPVQKKYAQMGGEIQKALGEKLVADTRSQIEPKVKALQQAITKRLDAVLKPPAPAK